MTDIQTIAKQVRVPVSSVSAAVSLLDEGNTIPFIARYRKEMTGELDEDQLRGIQEELERLRSLGDRRETILNTIREAGKLTAELEASIRAAATRTELEDIYLPYKPKRKTRASTARERGLQPLAKMILDQEVDQQSLDDIARPFLSEQVKTSADAWQGARDIAAEIISDTPVIRRALRTLAFRTGEIKTQKSDRGEDPREVYQNYYQFSAPLNRVKPHQTLAINRAESEGILSVTILLPEEDWKRVITRTYPSNPASPLAGELESATADAARRLLLPAIERDLRRQLTDQAERRALEVFAKNLRALLLQPPLDGYTVLGLDPGFRTGCKAAVVDPTGKTLETATIYPTPPKNEIDRARSILRELISKYGVDLIAIGNGTASRETETFVAELIKDLEGVNYLLVSEAGASVYSASKLAGRELPDMDVSLRGAVSIARRVQDPLAELVKIDPQSLGVGMYQHDVNQGHLRKTLEGVVESVVNQVGVEINTASTALLGYVSGIGRGLAERIVSYRDQTGPFQERGELLDVPGMGEKTFQQAAGFLRIRDGSDPLDTTAIHPESYLAARNVIQQAGLSLDAERQERKQALVRLSEQRSAAELAASLKIGVPTLVDIFKQLASPGRDPREDLPKPILRKDVLSMEDLVEGMELQGTVQNVVEFGAFVDLGVKNDGLLHRSKIPAGMDLNLGDVIRVSILSVDQDRGRISLGWVGN
ncbi:MAG: Tex family protein [Anaerolineales bacterium]